MVEAFPLHWPDGRTRTRPEKRQQAEIEATFAHAIRRAMYEARMLHAQGPFLSLNVPLGPKATPLEGYGDEPPDDSGAALYFNFDGERYCITCDHWCRVEDNIQAIALTIETLRRLQKISGFDLVRIALQGFRAASPPGGDKESWWSVLGVPFDAPLHAAEAAYRELVLVAHPDRGGTADAMSRLNIAISEVRLLLRNVGDD